MPTLMEYRVLHRGANELEGAINDMAAEGWVVETHTIHLNGLQHTVIMGRSRAEPTTPRKGSGDTHIPGL